MQDKTKSLSFALTCHLSFRLVQLPKFIDTFIWYILDKFIEWTELCREQSESNAIFPLSLSNTLSNLIVFYSFKHSLSILQVLFSPRESLYFSYLNLISYQKVTLICLGALFLLQLRPFFGQEWYFPLCFSNSMVLRLQQKSESTGELVYTGCSASSWESLIQAASEVPEFDI